MQNLCRRAQKKCCDFRRKSRISFDSGIGAGFVPKVLNTKLIDEIIKIDDDEAFYYGRLLARLEGLLSGISSGAALAATIKIGERKELINKRLIVILPSFGERYLSTAMFESNTAIQARKDGYL